MTPRYLLTKGCERPVQDHGDGEKRQAADHRAQVGTVGRYASGPRNQRLRRDQRETLEREPGSYAKGDRTREGARLNQAQAAERAPAHPERDPCEKQKKRGVAARDQMHTVGSQQRRNQRHLKAGRPVNSDPQHGPPAELRLLNFNQPEASLPCEECHRKPRCCKHSSAAKEQAGGNQPPAQQFSSSSGNCGHSESKMERDFVGPVPQANCCRGKWFVQSGEQKARGQQISGGEEKRRA
jgi:hypothetical protein